MKESIQKLAQELLKTWGTLGVNQRITIGFSGAAVILGIASLIYWSSRPTYTMLYGNLSPKEANKVVTHLENKSIKHQLKNSGTSIYVPREAVHRLRIDLAAQGIPQKGDDVGLEIFDRPAFGLSNMQQRVNYMRAVQGELTRTIRQMDGIESASVMIVIPENRLLVDNQIESSASVFVKTSYSHDVSGGQVRAIQFLVASSVEGLVPPNVSVTNGRGELLSRDENPDSVAFMSDRQLDTRRQIEAYMAQKAQDILTTVLGHGQAVVKVSAELNYDTIKRTEVDYNPDSVPLTTTETSDVVSTRSGAGNSSSPGVAANTTSLTNQVGALPELNDTKKTIKESSFAVGSTTNDIIQMAGGIKSLTAAVFVAKKKEIQEDQTVFVNRDAEEIESLTRIVAKALGITNTVDNLSVEQIEFIQPDPIGEPALIGPGGTMQEWINIGQPFVFAFLGLLVIRIFSKKLVAPTDKSVAVGLSLQDYARSIDADGNPLPRASRPIIPGLDDEFPESEETSRHLSTDVLNRLFKENPDNMTRAIRSWLHEDDDNGNN
ncbi:MAG: flagellar M-ring protein FliF [Verrucomicrobia bacterium]|nr:flagellar M-ring protein FliF [Verrucomicrobiota bacterium]